MGELIYIDSRQQANKHEHKNQWWVAHGVPTITVCLNFGDYQTDGSNISIDTKAHVDEIAANIGGKQHARFRRECQRAQQAGYRLIILVENKEGITGLHDLGAWINGHCLACRFYRQGKCNPRELSTKCIKHNKRKPIQGEQLARAMQTMSNKYGVRFMFCEPKDAAEIICKLLGVKYE